jgi:hypothetical protein
MFPELSKYWQEKLKREMQFVRKNGFYLTDVENLRGKNQFLSVLLDIEGKVKNDIFNFVKRGISPAFENKVFLQEQTDYHATIQWSKDYQKADINKLKEEIEKYFTDKKVLTGDLAAMYPSDNNIFAVSMNINVEKERAQVSKMFSGCGAKPHIKEGNPTLWVSLARITKKFTDAEINQAIKSLPKRVYQKVRFPKVYLAEIDPFFSRNSAKILTEVNLI